MTYGPRDMGELRTDESLKNQSHAIYHNGHSPLLKIGINLLTQIPLEPMHLLNLGIMKRIISRLFGKKRVGRFKLSDPTIGQLDKISVALAMFYPSDFARKPRALSDWSLFKATEFRRFLLYDGFLVLKNQPFKEVYRNYLLFACAIRILSDPNLLEKYNNDADVLLKEFVADSCKVYGQIFNIYNCHHLMHLSADCLLHGALEKFSAYKFEDFLGQLKALLHAPGRTLSQIVCRLMERVATLPPPSNMPGEELHFSDPHNFGPLGGLEGQQFQKLKVNDICISAVTVADSFCLTRSKDIVKVQNIVKSSSGNFIVGRKFLRKGNYFTHPFPSSKLDIFEVHTLGPLTSFNIDSISRKVVMLPLRAVPSFDWETEKCLCLPMLHA